MLQRTNEATISPGAHTFLLTSEQVITEVPFCSRRCYCCAFSVEQKITSDVLCGNTGSMLFQFRTVGYGYFIFGWSPRTCGATRTRTFISLRELVSSDVTLGRQIHAGRSSRGRSVHLHVPKLGAFSSLSKSEAHDSY
jgi:hypothetical protein